MSEKTTINTRLQVGTGSGSSITWADLCGITSYPDIITPPERIDVTDMTMDTRAYEPGIKDTSSLEFEAIYDAAKYSTIAGYEDTEKSYRLIFGDATTNYGSWAWTGKCSVTPVGKGVNEARTMKITFYPTSEPTFTAGSSSST